MTYEIYLTILSLIALGSAVAGILGLFVVSRGLVRFGTFGLISLLFWTLVITNVLTIAASARFYSEFSYAFGDHSAIHPLVSLLLRVVKMGLVGVSGLAIAMALIRGRLPKGGYFLLTGLLLVYVAMVFSMVLGKKFYYSDHIIIVFLMLLAIVLSPQVNPERVARQFKLMFAVVIYGALVLALIDPGKYLQVNYVGLIPGLNYRLHGLAVHANSMAPLAVMYVILALWVPSRKWIEIPNVMASLLTLLLTQSKTNWVALLLLLAFMLAVYLVRRARDDFRTGTLSLVFAGAIFGSMIFVAYVASHISAFLDMRHLPSLAGVDLYSVTGRTRIWEITLEAWKRFPWFGYGPTLWNQEFRLASGFLAAGDAHSQYFQTLGEVGIFGSVAFVVYVAAMLYVGIRFLDRTHGASLALVVFMLFRGLTEVTFKLSLTYDMTTMTHMMVFVLLLLLARSHSSKPAGEHHSVRATALTTSRLPS